MKQLKCIFLPTVHFPCLSLLLSSSSFVRPPLRFRPLNPWDSLCQWLAWHQMFSNPLSLSSDSFCLALRSRHERNLGSSSNGSVWCSFLVSYFHFYKDHSGDRILVGFWVVWWHRREVLIVSVFHLSFSPLFSYFNGFHSIFLWSSRNPMGMSALSPMLRARVLDIYKLIELFPSYIWSKEGKFANLYK